MIMIVMIEVIIIIIIIIIRFIMKMENDVMTIITITIKSIIVVASFLIQ